MVGLDGVQEVPVLEYGLPCLSGYTFEPTSVYELSSPQACSACCQA